MYNTCVSVCGCSAPRKGVLVLGSFALLPPASLCSFGRKGKPAPGSANSFFRCPQAPRRSEDNPKLDAALQI